MSPIPSSTQPAECRSGPYDYEIAPNGDVVLILNRPNAPFAAWDSNDPAVSISATSTENDLLKPPAPAPSNTFLVSSHHLRLASSVFSAAFAGPWSESVLAGDGHHRIATEDWDVEAFLILLNILHGRNNRVPTSVTLETLCKISVLVDYYRVHEAVRFPSMHWLNGLRDSIPRTYRREMLLWLCISWVFQDDFLFRVATETTILESTGPVSTRQLPIPERVISMNPAH
ncbi:hypothetical protein VTI28DRAFT_4584 [Corynascus sepedonium]